MLLTAWSQHDPTAALAYAQANSRSGFAATTILSSWAATDPEAAIRWAQANHTGTDANPYLAGIIRTLGATDPARASGLLTGMPRSQERGEALDAMLPHLLAQGADATRAWISALTDDSLRNGSMMRAADARMAAIRVGKMTLRPSARFCSISQVQPSVAHVPSMSAMMEICHRLSMPLLMD